MLKDVVEIEIVGDHRLRLRFEDRVEGEVDVSTVIPFDGVFAPLGDPKVFATVRVDPDLGTLVWPNGANLDPDVLLYVYALARGEPVPDLRQRIGTSTA